MEEEISFPRGGSRHRSEVPSVAEEGKGASSSSTPADKKQSRKRSNSGDFLFGKDETKSKKLKKTKKKSSDDSSSRSSSSVSKLPIGGGGVLQPSSSKGGKKPALIESVSFQKLAKGTKILGIVREVTSEYAIVSLPTMLTGYVRRSIIAMDKIVSVGMMLPVVVQRISSETVTVPQAKTSSNGKKTEKKRRIELSFSPAMLNSGLNRDMIHEGMTIRGRIQSVEDHGCIVDLGVSGLTSNSCFLKFENIEASYDVIDLNEDGEEDDERMDTDQESVIFPLNEGRVYDFTISSMPSKTETLSTATSIIQLKLQTAENRSKIVTGNQTSTQQTIRTLCPGMLLNVTVEHFARNGLCVSFLGHVFRGSIDSNHIGAQVTEDMKKRNDLSAQPIDQLWWKSVFVGDLRTIKARLVVVDPVTKIIRLSLLPHVLQLAVPSTKIFPSIGAIVENAKVVRLDPGIGALLALPSNDVRGDDDNNENSAPSSLDSNRLYALGSTLRCAYVHISKAMDDGNTRTPEAEFSKKFSLNTTIPKLKVLSTSNWMDNVISCATSESIVSSAVLTHSDLRPGAIYKSVPIVSTLKGGGVFVQLSAIGNIKGLVPAMHLFDRGGSESSTYRSKIRMEKFKVGNKIDVRCLFVDAEEKKCLLTTKKSLLTSDIDNPISDYSKIEVGRIATGFVTRVSKQGIVITFYNNIYGRISSRSLADELGVEDPTVDYKVGDVIKARVVNVAQRSQTIEGFNEEGASVQHILSLSLKTSGGDDNDALQNDENVINMTPGLILPPKCMKVVEFVSSRSGGNDNIMPGYASVTIKPKYLSDVLGKEVTNAVTCRIPFEQVQDSYEDDEIESPDALDTVAKNFLKIGKRVDRESMIMSTSSSGIHIISLKPSLISTSRKGSTESKVLLPRPTTALVTGSYVQGYCARVDNRYGAFIRFLDNLTGLVSKLKGGLDIKPFETVYCKVTGVDTTAEGRQKILLKRVQQPPTSKKRHGVKATKDIADLIKTGDKVGDVRVHDLNFARATVSLTNKKFDGYDIKARIHVTMAVPLNGKSTLMPISNIGSEAENLGRDKKSQVMSKHHPFYSWRVGSIIKDAVCVSSELRDEKIYMELTNRSPKSDDATKAKSTSLYFKDTTSLKPGIIVNGIITSIASQNRGVWVQICPGVSGFIAGLDLSDEVEKLNNMGEYFKIGGRIECVVMEDKNGKRQGDQIIRLSVMAITKASVSDNKPCLKEGEKIIGQVNRNLKQMNAPALMINLGEGLVGRCDITELADVDEWSNMPLGRHDYRSQKPQEDEREGELKTAEDLVTASDSEQDNVDDVSWNEQSLMGEYPNGLYVQCIVLESQNTSRSSFIEVSLRDSRKSGNLDDDEQPKEKDIVQAYVIQTTKKGCFFRLSRSVEGRAILKELSDSFLHNPISLFPQGRLVVAKVKSVKSLTKGHQKNPARRKAKTAVDLDLRESVLLEDQSKMAFDDVKEGEKYRGVVTRIESYGVFVRLDNSDVSGLVHLSECSDDYVKNISALYNPGDLVKVLIVRVDKEERRIGMSLKASNFNEDDESVGESSSSDSADSSDDEDVKMRDASDDLDSDDENFVSKLATKMKDGEDEVENSSTNSWDSDSSDDDDSDSESDDSSSASSDDEGNVGAMDTDVGFDWGDGQTSNSKTASLDDGDSSSSDSSDSEDDDENDEKKSSHKSRKKAAAKKDKEKEIAQMEQRIADGLADENPETEAEFERLLASDPNSSEIWMRYMSFHLSLANIDRARKVANQALERIEFRREQDKLNIFLALITIEHRYGTPETFDSAISRAAQYNNPKQVYLRVCEMLEKDTEKSKNMSTASRTDEMFTKMCKKFKSKKTVWVACFRYFLKNGRYEKAHELRKRSLMSLAQHKHIEVMSRYAQLEYEYGSAERARTIFDGLIDKHAKRLDLMFVYVDKEVKYGEVNHARRIFQKVAKPPEGHTQFRFSDKQMKSLFKKWYRIEDEFGNEESQQAVKLAAKEYVDQSLSAKQSR